MGEDIPMKADLAETLQRRLDADDLRCRACGERPGDRGKACPGCLAIYDQRCAVRLERGCTSDACAASSETPLLVDVELTTRPWVDTAFGVFIALLVALSLAASWPTGDRHQNWLIGRAECFCTVS